MTNRGGKLTEFPQLLTKSSQENTLLVTMPRLVSFLRWYSMVSRAFSVCFVGLICLAGQLAAAPKDEITGKVISVSDGDTIKLLVKKQELTIRLEGIDAPEYTQDFGTKSRQALAALVSGKTVTVRKSGIDKFGRTLGFVFVDGKEVNAKQLEDGWAWHYKAFNNDDRLAKLEAAARQGKRGLWGGPNPIEPWEYRKIMAAKKQPR